jgi:hypothetical protein
MRLVSGEQFNSYDFNIEDIAHSLSMICRWGGHTKTWHSVAEHSVRVANCLDGRDRYYGILHDAAEYIWGDLCSPLKGMVPFYVLEVKTLQAAIYRFFGLSVIEPKSLRVADLKIRQWEYDNYVIAKGDAWPQESSRLRFLDTFLANNATEKVSLD